MDLQEIQDQQVNLEKAPDMVKFLYHWLMELVDNTYILGSNGAPGDPGDAGTNGKMQIALSGLRSTFFIYRQTRQQRTSWTKRTQRQWWIMRQLPTAEDSSWILDELFY